MSKYADAYNASRIAEREAVLWDNPNCHRAAVHDERVKRLGAAREKLGDVIPARAGDETAPAQEKATEDLRNLRPTDADAVALIGNEWTKVDARLNAGHNLAKGDRVGRSGDPRGDRGPHTHQADSDITQPDDAIAEIEGLAVERLASMGDPTALASVEASGAEQLGDAWAAVLEQAVSQHSVSATRSTLLYNADVEEWRATVAQTPDDDHLAEKAIRDVSANLDFGGSPLLNASGSPNGTR